MSVFDSVPNDARGPAGLISRWMTRSPPRWPSSPVTAAAPLETERAELRQFFQWASDLDLPPLAATRRTSRRTEPRWTSADWPRRQSIGDCRRCAATTASPTSTAASVRTRRNTSAGRVDPAARAWHGPRRAGHPLVHRRMNVARPCRVGDAVGVDGLRVTTPRRSKCCCSACFRFEGPIEQGRGVRDEHTWEIVRGRQSGRDRRHPGRSARTEELRLAVRRAPRGL